MAHLAGPRPSEFDSSQNYATQLSNLRLPHPIPSTANEANDSSALAPIDEPLLPLTIPSFNTSPLLFTATMADQVQEMLDVPREFLKDGIQFINRAQKRTSIAFLPCLSTHAQTCSGH